MRRIENPSNYFQSESQKMSHPRDNKAGRMVFEDENLLVSTSCFPIPRDPTRVTLKTIAYRRVIAPFRDSLKWPI